MFFFCLMTEVYFIGHILPDSIYVAFLRRQNRSEKEQISGCQELRVGRMLLEG